MHRKFYKRKPLTKTHKENISKALKGHLVSAKTRGKISEAREGEKHPFFGKHHSIATKEKMRIAHLKNGKTKDSNGKTKDSRGYILIHKPEHPFCNHQKYVRESRLIVESQIGRYLKPEEVCHHTNRNKQDNRPENLMAFTSNSAHIKFHYHPENVKPEEIVFDGRKLKQPASI